MPCQCLHSGGWTVPICCGTGSGRDVHMMGAMGPTSQPGSSARPYNLVTGCGKVHAWAIMHSFVREPPPGTQRRELRVRERQRERESSSSCPSPEPATPRAVVFIANFSLVQQAPDQTPPGTPSRHTQQTGGRRSAESRKACSSRCLESQDLFTGPPGYAWPPPNSFLPHV